MLLSSKSALVASVSLASVSLASVTLASTTSTLSSVTFDSRPVVLRRSNFRPKSWPLDP